MRSGGLEVESVKVHKVLRLPRNLHFQVHKVARATKSALRGSQSAVPAAKSALPGSQSAVLPRNQHFEVHKVLCLPRNLQTRHMSQKLQFTAPVTKSEHLDDPHLVQSAAPATKSAYRSKAAPIPCACH